MTRILSKINKDAITYNICTKILYVLKIEYIKINETCVVFYNITHLIQKETFMFYHTFFELIYIYYYFL